MGQLHRDIEAIANLSAISDHGSLGFIETDYGQDVPLVAYCGHPSRLGEELEWAFVDCDQDARIAIAYVFAEQGEPDGAWAEAARDFCDDDIAGVFVIERSVSAYGVTSALFHMVQKKDGNVSWEDLDDDNVDSHLLEYFPTSFWEAGLPILFDESGQLSKIAFNSKKLDLDPRLRFEDPDKVKDLKIAFNGCWNRFDRSPFPIYNATRTDLGRDIETVVALELLNTMDGKSRVQLDHAIPRDALSFDFCPPGIFELASFMNAVLPGSADEEVLWTYGDKEPNFTDLPRYAIGFELSETKIEEVGKAARQLFQACVLAAKALESRRLAFYPHGHVEETIEAFREVMRMLGVDHQVEALNNGVPIEDIVA